LLHVDGVEVACGIAVTRRRVDVWGPVVGGEGSAHAVGGEGAPGVVRGPCPDLLRQAGGVVSGVVHVEASVDLVGGGQEEVVEIGGVGSRDPGVPIVFSYGVRRPITRRRAASASSGGDLVSRSTKPRPGDGSPPRVRGRVDDPGPAP
jgi:hypothetical protein